MDGLLMAVVQKTVTVIHEAGLHARPAALFVQVAKGFTARVTVKRGRKIVDGKSIMGLLTLAAKGGSRIAITADGPDAQEAVNQLARMVTTPLSDISGDHRR